MQLISADGNQLESRRSLALPWLAFRRGCLDVDLLTGLTLLTVQLTQNGHYCPRLCLSRLYTRVSRVEARRSGTIHTAYE